MKYDDLLREADECIALMPFSEIDEGRTSTDIIADLARALRECAEDAEQSIRELSQHYDDAPGLPLDDPANPPSADDLTRWTNFLTYLGMWIGCELTDAARREGRG